MKGLQACKQYISVSCSILLDLERVSTRAVLETARVYGCIQAIIQKAFEKLQEDFCLWSMVASPSGGPLLLLSQSTKSKGLTSHLLASNSSPDFFLSSVQRAHQ